jgi:hypothetical protein
MAGVARTLALATALDQKQGKLVAPFDRKTVSPRAYYVFTARRCRAPGVSDFVAYAGARAKRDEQASAR